MPTRRTSATTSTSAMKRVDEAVFTMIERSTGDDFPGGEATVFGLAEDGVGLGEVAEPAKAYQAKADAAAQAIIDGEIEVPEEL